jgi:hypothetical protein
MIRPTLIVALFLILLGIGGYFLSDAQSPTALIPTAIGILMLLLGLWAQKTPHAHIATGAAMTVALIGLIGVGMRLPKSAAAIHAASSAIPLAFFCQSIMALTCFIYLLMGIQNLIQAYHGKKPQGDGPEEVVE